MAAIGHVQSHWHALTGYLDHGHCVIDDDAERALRAFALGRRTRCPHSREAGHHAASVFHTLIESAKAQGHNPHVYIEEIQHRLSTTHDKHLDTQVPHRWSPPINACDSSTRGA
jgi:transposase